MTSHKSSQEWRSYLSDKDPVEWRQFIDTVGDKIIYFEMQALRHRVESMVDWKIVKKKAKGELESIPENVIVQLIETFAPFINELPAGHGRGHMYRDIIGITTLLHDPEQAKYDEVEILVGILGGVFHDIGNSVVERYLEKSNFSGHAEVGAYLFGIKAKHIIPTNLLHLIQFVIAAHTNYLQDLIITKNSETLVRQVYEDAIIDGNKISVLLARQSDRSDIQGIPGIIRHSLTKVKPTQDFSEGGFQKAHEDEVEDFRHQFTPAIRTKEYRDLLKKSQDKSTNVLEHLKMYADSNDGKSPYSRNDSGFVRDLIMNEGALQQYIFIAQDISLTNKLSKNELDEAFKRFFAVCKLFEPSREIDDIITAFSNKFNALSDEYQNHWANAFNLLITKLYQEWFDRKAKHIESAPQVKNKKLQEITTNLHSLANTYLEEFNPRVLEM